LASGISYGLASFSCPGGGEGEGGVSDDEVAESGERPPATTSVVSCSSGGNSLRAQRLALATGAVFVADGAEGGGIAVEAGNLTPNPLILGPLFRLVADRCDDLEFPRSRTFDVCGRFVLSRCHCDRKVSKRS
jgi:hypothetical protein